MRPLTKRQRQVLVALHDLTRAQGYPPSFREMMSRIGIKNTNAVSDHYLALAKRGLVRFAPHRGQQARTVTITPRGLTELGEASPFVFHGAVQCRCGASRIGAGQCPQCGEEVRCG